MFSHFVKRSVYWIVRLFQGILSTSASVDRVGKFMSDGDFPAAVEEMHRCLKRDPHNSNLIVVLSNCYEQLGNKALAHYYAEVAYTLDDTLNVGIFHWARALVKNNQCELALPLFALIKDNTPFAEGVNSELSAICMSLGDAHRAKEFQMTAWLNDFDSVRGANCYLFRLAYNNSDELLLAQEHQFWAETLQPRDTHAVKLVGVTGKAKKRLDTIPQTIAKPKSNKIRIGYWGGDFHEHSVRYFSRPLLENHNTERFEVFIYSDDVVKASADSQSKAFREITEDFYEVHELTNEDFEALVRSHDLDILVELFGHTSLNRANLLNQRMATVQITGLAYPPTTGHKMVDVKMVDPHIWTPEAPRYYTEAPLVLPDSFWCFDPMEEVPYCAEPPMVKNGFMTFGCFGNVAKITPPILKCWSSILERLPTSRLIIQSTVLVDTTTTAVFRKRLTDAGIREEQIELRRPTFGPAFWEAYQEVDAMLDTYPFNGGTTSCFATYVGVPVITWSGNSLISRMGRSIMLNLGYPQFVVDTPEEYVNQAILISSDAQLVTSFRREAPQHFKNSSLGNGRKFAAEFELACEALLKRSANNELHHESMVPPLPAAVLLHRAEMVWYNGNAPAAERIVELCLRYYPDCGAAYVFKSRQLIGEDRHQEAIDLLTQQAPRCVGHEAHEAWLLLARLKLIHNEEGDALQLLEKQRALPATTWQHTMQAELLKVALVAEATPAVQVPELSSKQTILVLIPCESEQVLEAIERHIRDHCLHPSGWDISFERCDPHDRLSAYNEALLEAEAEIVIFMQRNLLPWNAQFFLEVASTLEHCELLGCAGATSWRQKDWSLDVPENRWWGLIRPSQQAKDMFELQMSGTDRRKIVSGAVVLDGKFLACKPALLGGALFDEDLTDSQSLAEEDWSNRLQASGKRLSIHRNLGLLITESLVSFPAHSTQGQRRLWERLGLDPLALSVRDFTSISVPVRSPACGADVAVRFLS